MIQTIGPHKVTNVSIEHPLVDQMLQGERVRVLYSDPPWGDGNMKHWATMAQKMAGQVYRPLTCEPLLARLRQLIAAYGDGYVFIETSLRWEEQVKDALAGAVCGLRSFRLVFPNETRYRARA